MVPLASLPGFWHFMYRVSPFTYIIGAMLSTGLANHEVKCSELELLQFNPANNQTCGDYMIPYRSLAGGMLYNPDATSGCQFCTLANTNVFLESVDISYDHRWRDVGILWGYIGFNLFAAFFAYWLLRVPKKGTWAKLSDILAKVLRN
jgi:ATP-binding cassette, subfamily G (WHITE), member 2, PDR